MTGYGIGELLGRVFASYLIVLIVMFFISRFKGKIAIEKSIKWYGLLATVILFIIGISVSVSQSGAL